VSEGAPAAVRKPPAGDEQVRKAPLMRSTAHRSHVALGATFEVRGVWEVPAAYGSEQQEAEAIRAGLAIADISARGKLHLSGSIDPLVRHMTGGALDPMHAAGMTSGGVVARVARDFALALLEPSAETAALTALEDQLTWDAMVTDSTSAMSGYLVAGPLIKELFARSLTVDVEEIQPGRCLAARWAHIPAILVVSKPAAPVVEIYVGSEYGRYAWRILLELAGKLGGIPVGWGSLESSGWR
jgi:glycine cleavage system aminomethyltransferase T